MKSLLVACLLLGCPGAARAASNEIPYQPELRGQTVRCSDFKPGPDGSWVTLHAIGVQRQDEYTTVAADSSFKAGGQKTVGMDVGAVLDAVCPR